MIYKSKTQRMVELTRENERLRAENTKLIARVGVDMADVETPEGEAPAPVPTVVGRVDDVEDALDTIVEVLL